MYMNHKISFKSSNNKNNHISDILSKKRQQKTLFKKLSFLSIFFLKKF